VNDVRETMGLTKTIKFSGRHKDGDAMEAKRRKTKCNDSKMSCCKGKRKREDQKQGANCPDHVLNKSFHHHHDVTNLDPATQLASQIAVSFVECTSGVPIC